MYKENLRCNRAILINISSLITLSYLVYRGHKDLTKQRHESHSESDDILLDISNYHMPNVLILVTIIYLAPFTRYRVIVLCLLKNNLCTLITLSNEWLFVACCKTKFDYIEYTEMMLGGEGFYSKKS